MADGNDSRGKSFASPGVKLFNSCALRANKGLSKIVTTTLSSLCEFLRGASATMGGINLTLKIL